MIYGGPRRGKALFAFVVSVDDFIPAGTTLLLEEVREVEGKTPQVLSDLQPYLATTSNQAEAVAVHHYLMTDGRMLVNSHAQALASEERTNC